MLICPYFRERCHQPEILVKAVNNFAEVWQLNRYWMKRLKKEEAVSSQLDGLARVMEELTWELGGEPPSPPR